MIAVEGLTYRYSGSTRHALLDVELAVEPGEFLVVTGPSGCGKSTLALAIGGYLFRQYDGDASGSVTVGGLDIREQPIYDVAEVVGLVQQNPEAQFCTLTVRDEVAFGLENRRLSPPDIRERMTWALSIVEADHLADRALATLSGGEKQKVAIAAMMAAKPQVLIFDEPTSNLDPSATAEVFRVIDHIRAKAGITVIVIEHKVDYLLPFEPRLVAMEAGRIVQDGLAAMETRTSEGPSTNRPGPLSPGASRLVRVEDLHTGYNGRLVLTDVSLDVYQGEFVAVMGDNGSGKTTFLRNLLGLLKPDQGRVEILGQDTRRASVSNLARQVGLVFQNPDHQLFADSVWDEAVFGPRNFGALDGATTARIEDLLDRSGLGDRLQDHPYRLSYGQKRRLNLISVLANEPKILLLDEVLIGQDPTNAHFLLELLRERVRDGGSVIMVNHNPNVTRRYASRLVFLDSGRVIVDATVDEGLGQLAALGLDGYVAAGAQR